MQDSWELTKLVFGLRHERTFTITDIFGVVTDRIIPLQGYGAFPSDCFQKIGRSEDGLSIVIRDEEETIALNCNVDGIILECDMLAEPPISVESVQEMYSEILNIVLPIYDGKNKINRLGIIFQYQISPFENSAKEILSKLFKVNLKGYPDDVHFKFALKNPTSDAIFDPTKKTDYKNVIVNLTSKKEEDKKVGVPTAIELSIDYQRYYEPVTTFKDISIDEHLDNAISYIEKHLKTSEINIQPSKVKHG